MPTRILVIDDDRDDVEVLDRALMDHGYIPLLASSGEEALRGLERTRIIAVTGASDDAAAVKAAGFDGFIHKPIDPAAFVAAIEALLESPADGAA